MDSVVTSLVRSGDRALVLHAGKYGARWAEFVRRTGAACHELEAPPGETYCPDEAEQVLRHECPDILFLTHCETSVGITHDVERIAHVAREIGALIVLDAMTTTAVEPVCVDDWGIDVVIAASHKGFMCPPGVSMVGLSERAA
jgi:alanine-glyoxylate transaminase/serine-glyoxylate transaminase/serine-pyruvate transaminase